MRTLTGTMVPALSLSSDDFDESTGSGEDEKSCRTSVTHCVNPDADTLTTEQLEGRKELCRHTADALVYSTRISSAARYDIDGPRAAMH